MHDIRCPACKKPTRPGQLLLKADCVKGEIKCPRCGAIIKLDYPGSEPIAAQKK
nr:MAG TPA: Transcription initiation factor IIE, alpha FINGER, Transcription [Caudoviricetes sp.]